MGFHQHFKDVMGRLNFQIPDQQHQEWFIAGLLPHIQRPLIQQKVTSQPEALEIAMKLEASPTGDIGGMAQVQTQLDALTIQLVELTKGREKQEQVWCTKCRTKGHHKDECPTFTQYLAAGAPNPLPGGDTVRYVRNGAITPLSVHYYRSIKVHQRTCFAIFASR
jgi:hypothetical protein